ncbi:EAL domain-containing protein [Marivirga sp.]|uniref:EAL domain-containing protein n=1 Tax=Marivirga sp. TaxID=2018662 RepID=UPI0025F1A369|nr:EAL domain-containing protein [Marivirga sp.]
MDSKSDPKPVLKILSLEDSPMDAELIYEYLCENFSYEIQTHTVSKETDFISAITLGKYDLILSDFTLPGFNGFTSLKHAKAICPKTPFICVSGYIGEEVAVELLKQGATDYVAKDKLGRLIYAIERALKESEEREEKEKRANELIIANKELVKQKKMIERLNDQLEKRVKKRTVQLESANKELFNQITLRKLALEKIEQLAYYDFLTGLPNRVNLVDRMKQAINLAKRIESPIGILFLDLDGFKTINDTHGHFQGDVLLKAVATRLTSLVRESDTVARIGGDEFIIMLQNLKSADHILIVTNKIIGAFRQPFMLNHIEIFVTISIGISVFPADGETYETLIKNADLAMFKAKAKGKNQSVLCTTIMKDIIAENMKLSNDLYRSLERNEFEVYYQPQINLNTKKIVGLEALLHWNHPELGLVSPDKFIHLAEKTKLINPIGKWMLHTVCMQNKAWQKAGLPPIRVAVNLSIIQLQNPEITNQIKEILDETKLLPQYLELEITERIAMQDTDNFVRVLNAFQEIGIYISIDDFGTEYSSLKYLKLLPINRIRIPVPVIQGINGDERDEAITKTIIVLARNMGVDVIAKGVETQKQESYLAQRMCDETQGFYYYKPMPAKEIEVLLRTNC